MDFSTKFSIYFLILAEFSGESNPDIYRLIKNFLKNLTHLISYSVKSHTIEKQNVLGTTGQKNRDEC